jgi:transposase
VAEWRVYVEFLPRRLYRPWCRSVFVEQLDWLAENPCHMQRVALHIGKLCRDRLNRLVADMERLHQTTVKALDKIYMAEQFKRAPMPTPRAIGIGEIAIREGHDQRIVVSDLDKFHIISHPGVALDVVRPSEYRSLMG